MVHITFLAPYREMAKDAEAVFADHPRASEITHDFLVVKTGECPPLSAVAHADAVISRGFTSNMLAHEPSILSVELQSTGYDVLIAANECIRDYDAAKIGVVGTFSMTYGAEAIARVFPGVEIVNKTLEDDNLLTSVLTDLRDAGCDAILGGRSAFEAAAAMGIPCVLLKSGKEAIGSAIDEALRAIDVRRSEKRRGDWMAAIMNYTMEGIIATDPDGTVTMMNQFARALLRLNDASPIGRPVGVFLPDLPLRQMLRTNEPLLEEIRTIDDAMFVLNAVPLLDNQTPTGFVVTFQKGLQIQGMEDKIRKRLHPKGFVARYRFDDILGKSPAIDEVKKLAERYARFDDGVLILGETGCGKELFAQSIHNASPRAGGPFVAVNCAALPEHLLESELFGYVEGAFTGAAKGGKMGLFELAHNGTIFLDEIGDIAPVLQARLLRVLQEREVVRLGHDRVTPVDVRIIAATNRNLYYQVAEGRFRSDLLYRLEVLKLDLPPLRERVEDIGIVAESFFQRLAHRQGTRLLMVNDEALAEMKRQPWPGNIRELRNFCERLAVMTDRQIASREDVLRVIGRAAEPVHDEMRSTVSDPLPEAERIRELLHRNSGSRKKVAAIMGIDSSTLWRKMKRYGISDTQA